MLNNTLNLYFKQGSYSYISSDNSLSNILLHSILDQDSFSLSFGIIPLKAGTYTIDVDKGEFHYSKGISYFSTSFLFRKQHPELWEESLRNSINDPYRHNYYNTYTFAVVD